MLQGPSCELPGALVVGWNPGAGHAARVVRGQGQGGDLVLAVGGAGQAVPGLAITGQGSRRRWRGRKGRP